MSPALLWFLGMFITLYVGIGLAAATSFLSWCHEEYPEDPKFSFGLLFGMLLAFFLWPKIPYDILRGRNDAS